MHNRRNIVIHRAAHVFWIYFIDVWLCVFTGFVPRPTRLDFDQTSDGQSSGVEDLLPPVSEKRQAPPPPERPKQHDINLNKSKVQVGLLELIHPCTVGRGRRECIPPKTDC